MRMLIEMLIEMLKKLFLTYIQITWLHLLNKIVTFKKILTLHPVEVSSSSNSHHNLLKYFEVKQIEAVFRRCSSK